MNFTAYYPASYKGGTITQPAEYKNEAELAARRLHALHWRAKAIPNGNQLTLTMERKMARVVVEIDWLQRPVCRSQD